MPLSSLQRAAARNIERLISAWVSAPHLSGGRGQLKANPLHRFATEVGHSSAGQVLASPPGLSVSAFKADRVQFAKRATHFDHTPFLPTFEAAAYLEPALLTLRTLPEPILSGHVARQPLAAP